MRGAEPGAGVAVEVLVKRDEVVPGRVLGRKAVAGEHGAAAVGALAEDRDEPVGELVGDLGQGELVTVAGGELDGEAVAQEAVVDAERLDEQEVDGEPHRAAPVGVAAEQTGARLARLVVQGRR